ncbi:MAG TPA: SRPBCC family protein [Terriglobia bacterium]|nr:SRPBCC family protein [Terriglobia bacterium]
MAFNAYHFEDDWQIPFRIESVWEVLSKPTKFPQWWRGVYLNAVVADCTSDEPHVGQRINVLTRGWLPYKLRWTIETIRLDKPRLIEFKASGDFSSDASRWILRVAETGTDVTLDWNPIVEKPIIKLLSPLLKPVFRLNHRWAMNLGEKQIVDYIRSRNG